MRSMVDGLANSTSIASLSIVRNYVKPTTASGSPPFWEDICSYSIVNSINARKCSPRQTAICGQKLTIPKLSTIKNKALPLTCGRALFFMTYGLLPAVVQ